VGAMVLKPERSHISLRRGKLLPRLGCDAADAIVPRQRSMRNVPYFLVLDDGLFIGLADRLRVEARPLR
jgi:hypothetical protein